MDTELIVDGNEESLNALKKGFKTIRQFKVEQLKSTPEIGRIVSEINYRKIREIIYGNYRIIYRIEKKQISILTIRHGKQILPINEIMA